MAIVLYTFTLTVYTSDIYVKPQIPSCPTCDFHGEWDLP